jgi:ApbE superfamily uncharacterized protein (UPF0280 family)
MKHQKRTYREGLSTQGLTSFTVTVQETDLFISASQPLKQEAKKAAGKARLIVERYIKEHPDFLSSFTPLPFDEFAHPIIRNMLSASSTARVGPMAAVAGAIAEYTGMELLTYAEEAIVENGGDIFLKVNREVIIGIFAGESSLSKRIGIKIASSKNPLGVCTSSGTVGPSVSFGTADAVTVVSASAPLADAVATSIGNIINDTTDIQKGINFAQNIPKIDGIVIIKRDKMGAWGNIDLVSI